MKEKICVYTCITGDYDDLHEIKNIEKGIDYYCFTNNKKIKSSTWNVIYIEDDKLSNVQLARKIKILGHPIINDNYDILLWMDGAVVFKKNIKDFINKFLSSEDSFVAFRHGERNNIHDECKACVLARKETQDNVKKILQFYKKEKYPDNNGLIESTVYIKRPKDKKVIETMDLWFSMIVNYTHRDQLSFNYCIYKTGLNVKWINKKVFNNEWFKWQRHYPKSYNIDKYRVYFGDINDYDAKYDAIKNYKVKNNIYEASISVPCDTSEIYFEFSNVECTLLKNIKLNNKEIKESVYNSFVTFDDYKLFYERKGVVRVFNDFKKGDKIKFILDMEVKSGAELYDAIENLAIRYNSSKIEEDKLRRQLEKYDKVLRKIYLSRGWKILEKLRNIKPGKK